MADETNDSTWTVIGKKSKSKNKSTTNTPTLIPVNTTPLRRMKKSDYTLTVDEENLVNASEIDICCNCCSAHLIEKIIKRPFYACHTCFCCVGDDPAFNNRHNLIINVRDNPRGISISWENS